MISKKDILLWTSLTLLYFLWFGALVGLRNEHIFLWISSTFGWFYNTKSRVFLRSIAVWLCYWMCYDSLRIAPNWTVNAVHIKDLYDFDKAWFGVNTPQGIITLNEWCALHAQPVLDLLAGAFYITWVPLPVLFAIWLYNYNHTLYFRFSWCFFIVNIIGFCIYYIYPAAPPWYVAENGFALNPDVPRSAAALNRVDELLNINLFHSIYSRNSNVFAAMPSLHSAYPLVTLLYAIHSKRTWAIWLFGITSLGIWVAAIYTSHHYILDVLAGITVAALGYILYEYVILSRRVQQMM